MISLAFGASLFLLGFLASQLSAPETWQSQVLGCFALLRADAGFCPRRG